MPVNHAAERTAGLAIFGAWYFSRVVAEAAELSGWTIAGFVDPEPPAGVATLDQVPDGAAAIVAIGDNALRALVTGRLVEAGRRLATIGHPSAVVSPSATVGPGCYLGEHAVVRANAIVGTGVLLNAGAVVSHDCRIGDFVAFGPNAATASHVTIGSGTLLGVGASVRPHAQVGRDCVIGAGAAVAGDIGDGLMALGVPARCRPRNPDGGRQSDWAANRTW